VVKDWRREGGKVRLPLQGRGPDLGGISILPPSPLEGATVGLPSPDGDHGKIVKIHYGYIGRPSDFTDIPAIPARGPEGPCAGIFLALRAAAPS
jgi:hypothetical protein